jgi:hypothetical protein
VVTSSSLDTGEPGSNLELGGQESELENPSGNLFIGIMFTLEKKSKNKKTSNNLNEST